MKTVPIYLEDPYLKAMQATVLDVLPEKEDVFKLILDKTIFYPMGGGQPTDQGYIIFTDGRKNEIYQVLLKDDEINHYVKTTIVPASGKLIEGVIELQEYESPLWRTRY